MSQDIRSPFFDPAALAVTARHFRFLPGPAGMDIFPWVEGRRFFFRTLELAGHPYADYRSIPQTSKALDILFELHPDACGQSIIELGCIADGDPSHEEIARWARHNRLHIARETLIRAPYLDISGSWEEYCAGKRAKSWKNISRAQRLLEDKGGPLVFRVLDTQETIPEVFERCMALYAANWNQTNSSSIFYSEKGQFFLKDLLLALAKEGKAEIALLEQGQVLLAFAAAFKCDGTYYFYLFATNKDPELATYSVGKILIRDILKSAFSRGFLRFDFMAGEEPYKFEWTKLSRGRTSYYAVRDTFKGRITLNVFLGIFHGVELLKRQRWLRRLLACLGSART